MSYYCHVAFACFSSSSPLLCRPVSLWRKARWWTIETNACHGFSFSNLCLIFQSLQWWFKNLHPPFMCMAVTLNLTHDFNPRIPEYSFQDCTGILENICVLPVVWGGMHLSFKTQLHNLIIPCWQASEKCPAEGGDGRFTEAARFASGNWESLPPAPDWKLPGAWWVEKKVLLS